MADSCELTKERTNTFIPLNRSGSDWKELLEFPMIAKSYFKKVGRCNKTIFDLNQNFQTRPENWNSVHFVFADTSTIKQGGQ